MFKKIQNIINNIPSYPTNNFGKLGHHLEEAKFLAGFNLEDHLKESLTKSVAIIEELSEEIYGYQGYKEQKEHLTKQLKQAENIIEEHDRDIKRIKSDHGDVIDFVDNKYQSQIKRLKTQIQSLKKKVKK